MSPSAAQSDAARHREQLARLPKSRPVCWDAYEPGPAPEFETLGRMSRWDPEADRREARRLRAATVSEEDWLDWLENRGR